MAVQLSALLLFLYIIMCDNRAISQIMRPPKIQEWPGVTEGDKAWIMGGRPVVLTCRASGTPTPSIHWTKNEVKITSATEHELTVTESGTYRCIARNNHGTTWSSPVTVDIPRLEVTETTEVIEVIVKIGQPLLLNCSMAGVNSVPRAKPKWRYGSKKSTAIDATDTHKQATNEKGSLMFAFIDKKDASYLYFCTAYNSALRIKRVVKTYRLRLTNPDEQLREGELTSLYRSDSIIGYAGQTARVFCFTGGYPLRLAQWKFCSRDEPFPDSEAYYQDTPKLKLGSDLCLRCTINNDPKDIKIHVRSKPRWDLAGATELKDVNVTEGNDATFICDPMGRPKMSVTWYLNTQQLDRYKLPANVVLKTSDTKLVIKNAMKKRKNGTSDLMNIQCKVQNTYGEAHAEAYLNVLEKTRISFENVTRVIPDDVEEDLLLSINATTDPSTPIVITWYFKNKPINLTKSSPYTVQPNGSLLISPRRAGLNSSKELAGDYSCLATNSYSDARITIKTVPEIPAPRYEMIIRPEPTRFRLCDDITLECKIVQWKRNVQVVLRPDWYKDNVPIMELELEKKIEASKLVLVTRNKGDGGYADYGGNYTCRRVLISGQLMEASAEVQPYERSAPGRVYCAVTSATMWWIVIGLPLLLLIIFTTAFVLFVMRRRHQDSYPVEKKEVEVGLDPRKEARGEDFMECQRPEPPTPSGTMRYVNMSHGSRDYLPLWTEDR